MDLKDKSFLEDEFELEDIKVNVKSKPKQNKIKFEINKIDTNKYLELLNNFKNLKIILIIGIITVLTFCIIFIIMFFNNNKAEKINNITVGNEFKDYNSLKQQAPIIEDMHKNDIENIVKENLKQFENIQSKYNNNEEIIAYINILGTNISSPIVQTVNNTYYQDHDIYKNNNLNGTIYADTTSNINLFGNNTIIFGRTDIDNEQFFDLAKYENEEFYNQNRFVNLNNIYTNSVWEVYSFYSNIEDNFYLKTAFKEDEFQTFITSTKNLSKYKNDITVSKDDKILTLTSTNSSGDKYVLHAKLYKTN